jgi:hypothetical protein
MITRHANELYQILERVEDVGCAEVRKNQLLLWFGRDRLTKAVWQDVVEKWDEVSDDPTLLVGDAGDTWVFVYGKGLIPSATVEPWLKDVRGAGFAQN